MKQVDARKSLAFGYTAPIVAFAIDAILGVLLAQLNDFNLQVYIWLILELILGASIWFGAYQVRKASQFRSAKDGSQVAGLGGGKVSILVFTIVFGALNFIVALTYATGAALFAEANLGVRLWAFNLPATLMFVVMLFVVYRAVLLRTEIESKSSK
jgi:hypothetical protein